MKLVVNLVGWEGGMGEGREDSPVAMCSEPAGPASYSDRSVLLRKFQPPIKTQYRPSQFDLTIDLNKSSSDWKSVCISDGR